MNITMKNGRVTIDGKTFQGSNISINKDKVVVDGVTQDGELVGDINVVVHGDIETLSNSSGKIKAGNVGSIKTVSGDVDCCDVSGSVQTVSGDVKCGLISGNVKTVSGDIK